MIKIPEWLAALPKNRKVNTRDFASLLDVKPETLSVRASSGWHDFPRPDSTFKRGRGRIAARQWKAVTVRNYIRKLNRESEK